MLGLRLILCKRSSQQLAILDETEVSSPDKWLSGKEFVFVNKLSLEVITCKNKIKIYKRSDLFKCPFEYNFFAPKTKRTPTRKSHNRLFNNNNAVVYVYLFAFSLLV